MRKITAFALAAVPAFSLTQKKNTTSRIVIPVNIDGQRVTVRFTNICGAKEGRIDHAELVRCDKNGRIGDPAASVCLTQNGQKKIHIPAGAESCTDPVELEVKAGDYLAVSIFCSTKAQTVCSVGYRIQLPEKNGQDLTGINYSVRKPDLKKDEKFNQAMLFSAPYFKALDIETESPAQVRSLIVIGDSITAQARWMEPFTRQMYRKFPGSLVISNYGICGNQMAQDPPSAIMKMFGKAAVDRIRWDGGTDYGVTEVLTALGINDLGLGKQQPDTYLDACRRFVSRCHDRGWKVSALAIYPGTPDPKRLEEVEAYRIVCNKALEEIYDRVIPVDDILKNPDGIGYKTGFGYGDGVHLREPEGQLIADRLVEILGTEE